MSIFAKLTEEQRVKKACGDILEKAPEFRGVLQIGTKEVVEDCPTARTNGRDEWYGRAFVKSLSDPELRFLIMHEVGHKMLQHLTTWSELHEEDPNCANRACDYYLNLWLTQDYGTDGWIVMPKGGCYDERFAGMNSKQIYKLLRKEQEQEQEQEDGEGTDEGTPSNEQDSGKPSDGGQDMDGEDGEDGGQPQPGQGKPSKPKQKDKQQGFDEHDWEGAQELTKQEQEELAEQIDTALRETELMASKAGTGGSRVIKDILQSKVRWEDELREILTAMCPGTEYQTWARPNRRFMGQQVEVGGVMEDVYMPSTYSQTIKEMIIAIDMSGSIGDSLVAVFLGEVAKIAAAIKPEVVRVIYWDTEVCSEEMYRGSEVQDIVKCTKPKGGGGTDVNCVTRYMQQFGIKPDVAIVLTDGDLYAGWGTWPCPVVWAIADNPSANPTVGRTVHVEV
jgi:predicted metal-dependent peptidase